MPLDADKTGIRRQLEPGGDRYLATTGDSDPATSGDFSMATDRLAIRPEADLSPLLFR